MDSGSSGARGSGGAGSAGGISDEGGSGTRATSRGARLQKSDDVKTSRGIATITPAAIVAGTTIFRRTRARRTKSRREIGPETGRETSGGDDEKPRERPPLGSRHPVQSGNTTRRGATQGS